MTRAKIRRLPEPYRSLVRALHAAPSGQRGKKRRELVLGVAAILKAEQEASK